MLCVPHKSCQVKVRKWVMQISTSCPAVMSSVTLAKKQDESSRCFQLFKERHWVSGADRQTAGGPSVEIMSWNVQVKPRKYLQSMHLRTPWLQPCYFPSIAYFFVQPQGRWRKFLRLSSTSWSLYRSVTTVSANSTLLQSAIETALTQTASDLFNE